MALKKGHQIATIDVELITVVTNPPTGGTPIELGLKTSSQINVDPQIETTDAIKLIIKGILEAQKRQIDTITGHTLTITDNVFNPQLVQILQGGEIDYDEEGNFLSYTPPIVGLEYKPVPFTLCAYAGHYDASGIVLDYEKTEYPNCTGIPISMSIQDNVFTTPTYTVLSAPAQGQAPYNISMVKKLPEVANASWLAQA